MEITYNPMTGRFDVVGMTTTELASFVRISGATMTGPLIITPTEETALKANKDIVLKAGQKLIFDGA